MSFYLENYHWVLYITGALTVLPIMGFFNPVKGMEQNWGRAPSDIVETIVQRHWSLTIAVVGAMLIWGGFNEDVRLPIVLLAVIEKTGIVFMIASNRAALKDTKAGGVMIADAVMTLLLAPWLFLS